MPYIEAAVLQDLIELLGAEDVHEVTQAFVERFGGQLDELRNALQRSELETVVQVAHGLKGSAANLGAYALSEIAARVEHAARAGNLPLAAETAESLSEVCLGTVAEMRAHGFLPSSPEE